MDGELPASIAIDGPAASGKTTIGLAIAAEFDYAFLDTGLMYRAVTLAALRAGVPPEAKAIPAFLRRLDLRVEATPKGTRVFLGKEDVTGLMREPEVEANVSRYSAIAEVREAMVRQQREVAARGRAVLAGRDIGTVVLPDAPLKFYLDASEEARASRRGKQATQDATKAKGDISNRDKMDSTRTVSPLKPADDAVVVDTTNLSEQDVIELALEKVRCAND